MLLLWLVGTIDAYLGGAAVMAGFVAAVLFMAGDWRKTLPLVGGVALLWVVRTIDDRRTVSPGIRIVVELALAGLVWAVGLGWNLHMGGPVDLALTCVWVLAVVNAFNLFDNTYRACACTRERSSTFGVTRR